MENIPKKEYPKYFLVFIFLLMAVLSFFIIKDLIVAILGAVVLAYFIHPIYKKTNKFIKNKSLASFSVIIFLLLIVTIPLFFIIKALITESKQAYYFINSLNLVSDPTINKIIERAFSYISQLASDFILTIPNRVIGFVVMLFILFFLIRDGEKLVKLLKDRIPIENKKKELLFKELKITISGVGYGVLLTGILEGIIAGIGFYLFDVSSYVLWGFVIVILAILPAVGATIVWIPAMLIKFFNGETFNAIGILITGIIISLLFEIILKSKLIGDKSKVHPILITLGVLGGMKFLGIVGIIFGPIILTTFLTLLNFVIRK